ncbi:MAG TPA: malto-oligosyltrehalose trehalohydrolase [Xanthobacteraceae bacterium]|jgi:malto-oligosyltrehalose trehalohydrolase
MKLVPAQFGPQPTPAGISFRLWAPAAKAVDLILDRSHPMKPFPDGWYELTVEGARAGALYKFRIDRELEVPDPASHFQPHDVGGPSEVIDHDAYRWNIPDWRGRPWQDAALLELHVGTFTPAGSFLGAMEKLDHIVDSGVTAIELMPVADFSGARNWGYDGVLLYAPDSSYGRPEDLKALIDAAHARGLMVFLDVVYNHFGPQGNYLACYAPAFFTSAQTPWGHAVDYRVAQVRAFAIENALHWLSRYRFDGLRLDAVHAIAERGQPSILRELSRAVGCLASATGRTIHLVLENDDNAASLLDPCEEPPRGAYRAQWNDDYHHAWHALLTREAASYYQDYVDRPLDHIARSLRSGFSYQGDASRHRDGRLRGEPSGALSPLAFVNFLQNHDQIGNRALGDRLSANADSASLMAALAVTLLAPMPPLLFMGEEWGSTRPFPFFCDFTGDLAEAVRRGRRREFAEAYARFGDAVADPLAEATFRSAVLDWSEREEPQARERLAFVRRLLATRRREIVPRLAGTRFGSANHNGSVLSADWLLGDGSELALIANLSDEIATRPAPAGQRRRIWGSPENDRLPPWSVCWTIGTN